MIEMVEMVEVGEMVGVEVASRVVVGVQVERRRLEVAAAFGFGLDCGFGAVVS